MLDPQQDESGRAGKRATCDELPGRVQLLLHQVLDEAAGAALLQQGDDLERLVPGEFMRAEQGLDASPLRAATGMRDQGGLLSFA